MPSPELVHLELLAEVDAISARLERWANAVPPWEPAEGCRAFVRRLLDRSAALRTRLEAPLIVAVLGGTGVGKSALINALVGDEVATVGRARPTTLRPLLVCRPELSPELLGIGPGLCEVVQRDLPALADRVLVDCPDPDTTEDDQAANTNLARLRAILVLCDVILVVSTQQKYRSSRVAEELAAASAGARLVFVQTHADVDQDIRDDWRRVLAPQYATGEMFFVDSPAALADVQSAVGPQGEMARLLDLLEHQLAGAAGNRIRRANFLDLVADTLAAVLARIDNGLPAVAQLEQGIQAQRTRLGAHLAKDTRAELIEHRREWEMRLLGRAASRWGFSPFALVLRLFQGLGGLLSRAVLLRARTPAQMALWGAVEAARSWRQQRSRRRADAALAQTAAGCWDPAELRSAAVIITGYAGEAGVEREAAALAQVREEAQRAGADFAGEVAAELDSVLDRLAARNTGWFTRWRYEILLGAMLGLLVFRLGKNFFYDSWLAPQPVAPYGLDFYLSSTFWLVLWSLLLCWSFTARLQRGLRREIDRIAVGWIGTRPAAGVFTRLEDDCRKARQCREDLLVMQQQVAELRRRVQHPGELLGHRR